MTPAVRARRPIGPGHLARQQQSLVEHASARAPSQCYDTRARSVAIDQPARRPRVAARGRGVPSGWLAGVSSSWPTGRGTATPQPLYTGVRSAGAASQRRPRHARGTAACNFEVGARGGFVSGSVRACVRGGTHQTASMVAATRIEWGPSVDRLPCTQGNVTNVPILPPSPSAAGRGAPTIGDRPDRPTDRGRPCRAVRRAFRVPQQRKDGGDATPGLGTGSTVRTYWYPARRRTRSNPVGFGRCVHVAVHAACCHSARSPPNLRNHYDRPRGVRGRLATCARRSRSAPAVPPNPNLENTNAERMFASSPTFTNHCPLCCLITLAHRTLPN